MQQGSLYPALHRLEQQGWIRAKWAETDTGRNAKFYSLTAAGRTQLARGEENWSSPFRRHQPSGAGKLEESACAGPDKLRMLLHTLFRP